MKQVFRENNFWDSIALLNGMLGGPMLILPILFKKTGLAQSLIVVILVGMMQWLLSALTLYTLLPSQIDPQQAVLRLMGSRMHKIYEWAGLLYTIFWKVFYYQLITDQIYSILIQFFTLPNKNEMVFHKFSIQYLDIGVALLILCMLNFDDLDIIRIISHIGSIGIYLYIVFLIIEIIKQSSYFDQIYYIKGWEGNPADLILTICFSFNLQGYFLTAIRMHKDYIQAYNAYLVLFTCYIISMLIYGTIGTLGYYAILQAKQVLQADTIVDYFQGDRFVVVSMTIFYTLHLISIIPTASRMLILRIGRILQLSQKTINFTVVAIGFTLVLFRKFIPLQLILNLNGGIFSYLMVYFFPCLCYLLKVRKQQYGGLLRYAKQSGISGVFIIGLMISLYGLVQTIQGLVE